MAGWLRASLAASQPALWSARRWVVIGDSYPFYYGYPAPVYPPAPYWGPGPFWGPYGYYGDCYRRAVWRGRHWRYVRVCY